jgi:ComF family protein
MPNAFPSALRAAAGKAADFLLPPLCLACDAPVGMNAALCPDCWGAIHFIAAPLCTCCGAPFETPVGDGLLCAGCIAQPPTFTAARAAMLYDDASRKLVLGFKHGDRTHPARSLASWMQRAGAAFWPEAGLLIPVPLHRWRLFQRRYNQAALLAQALSGLTGTPMLPDALLRLRPTPVQGHMNRKERQANVAGAFAVDPHRQVALAGKTVVLIDDVLTTGATVNECSEVLLKAGAGAVKVLTLARVKAFV